MEQHYDVRKIANAIIFFIDSNVKYLGITKLMKLCFYADKYHLEQFGKPIFNHTYTKLPRGPVPTWLYSIIRTKISGSFDYDFEDEVKVFNKFIATEEIQWDEGTKVIFTKLKEFDKKYFSKSQIKILMQVSEEFKNISASAISELSHETNAWKSVDFNEIITYESMVDDEEISKYIAYSEFEKTNYARNLKFHKFLKAC